MIYDEMLTDLGEFIEEELGNSVLSFSVAGSELCVNVKRDDIVKVALFLRDNGECLFSVLVDICGVDYPDREERFEIVYNFLSLKHNNRVRIKVTTDENTPVPSLCSIYSSAGWFEREVWDMFGVLFDNHPDLRRILTDYGFEGHPLRKDFPLTGFEEIRYDDDLKRIVYEPVKLEQDFRNFDYLSPWEGVGKVVLPGDEKAEK